MPPSPADGFVADMRDAGPEGRLDRSRESAPDLDGLARPRRLSRTRLVLQLSVCAALIAGLSLAARDRLRAPEPARSWTDPPRAERIAPRQIAATEPLLTLIDAAFSPSAPPPRVEPSRWDATRGQREDSVSQGGFDAIEAPWLLVTATDAGARTESPPSLFVTLVRRAADGRGLAVTRTGERGVVATRYGTFETLETVLSGDGTRTCTGFRSLALNTVHLDGWLCGILGQAPEKREVACAIDRIALSGRVAAALGAGEAAGQGGSTGGSTGETACGTDTVAKAVPGDRTGSIAVAAMAGAAAATGAARHITAKARRK